MTLNDGRTASNGIFSGKGIVTHRMRSPFPITWKGGVKLKRETHDSNNTRSSSFFDSNGSGAGVGVLRDLRSGLNLDLSQQDLSTASTSGRGVLLPSLMKVASEFRANPGYFAPTQSAREFYNANVSHLRT